MDNKIFTNDFTCPLFSQIFQFKTKKKSDYVACAIMCGVLKLLHALLATKFQNVIYYYTSKDP